LNISLYMKSRYSSTGTCRMSSSPTVTVDIVGTCVSFGAHQRTPSDSRKVYTPYSVPRTRPPTMMRRSPTVRMINPSSPRASVSIVTPSERTACPSPTRMALAGSGETSCSTGSSTPVICLR
jgi:hypothetical protein